MKLIRALSLVAALGLASCSLPPDAAWHVVKTDGLIPLMAMEFGCKPYPASLVAYQRHPIPPNNSYMGTPYDRAGPEPVSAPLVVMHTDESGPRPLPQRPDAVTSSTAGRDMSGNRPPRPNLITKKRGDSSPAEDSETPRPTHSPAVIATAKTVPEPEAPEKKEAPEPKKEVAPTPAPAKQMSPAAQPPAKPADDLPYGIAIPGRPGLVNSPYAAKNQFVDVAGLKPGQEVKCPYSGKLFRVPVGAQASAAPEKSEDNKKQ